MHAKKCPTLLEYEILCTLTRALVILNTSTSTTCTSTSTVLEYCTCSYLLLNTCCQKQAHKISVKIMIATDHDVRRLRQKDPQLKSLSLNFSFKPHLVEGYHHSQGLKLQGALKENASVSDVVIFVDDSFPSSSADLALYDGIWRDIGRLSALKTLQVASAPHANKGVLPVRVLAPLLQATTQLETLGIHDLALTGSQADFDRLAEEVQRLWYLQCFILQRNDCPSGARQTSQTIPMEPGSSLDALLLSLSLLPNLQTLTLNASKRLPRAAPPFSPQAFSALFTSSSIRTLKVEQWDWSNDYSSSMARLLQCNLSLQALTLGPLPKMTLQVAKSLAAVLRDNQSLAHLELILSHMLSDDCAVTLAKALHSSSQVPRSGLKSLVLSGKRLGRATKACPSAFQEMIEHNYSLHKVFLFRKNFLQPTLQFYTRLNAIGRHSLLRLTDTPGAQHPEATWMEALAHPAVRDDLDAIYYFLSSNPSIFVQSGANKTTKRLVAPEDVGSSLPQQPLKRRRRA
jgi:hypothetical protein